MSNKSKVINNLFDPEDYVHLKDKFKFILGYRQAKTFDELLEYLRLGSFKSGP